MKKEQHQRSVETLGLSVHGDEYIIEQIDQLIHDHAQQQPYARNTLLRIQSIINKHLNQGADHETIPTK